MRGLLGAVLVITLLSLSPRAAYAESQDDINARTWCEMYGTVSFDACRVRYFAMMASQSVLPATTSPPDIKYVALSWQTAKALDTPTAYSEYVSGWEYGIKFMDMTLGAIDVGIRQYTGYLEREEGDQKVNRRMLSYFQEQLSIFTEATPFSLSNAQVAANRIALLYADFTPQANGVQVTPKVDGVTEVPGTSKLVDGVIQSTIEIDGYQFTYVSGHNDFKTYVPPTTPSSPEASAKKLTATPTPKISGTVKVGKTLTAKAGTWKPSGVKLSYQWYRNGKKIDEATKSSYKLVGADKGKKVTVKVTGSKTGYKSVTKTSKATKKVATGTLQKGSVKITGSKVVGSTLTVTLSKWTPEITAKYQWYRGSKKIKGATKASYTLTKSDKNKKIKVKVKVTKSGYKSVSKTAKAVKIK